MGSLHNYVTPKMTVFDPPTHPVTLRNVSLDPPTHPPQRYVTIVTKTQLIFSSIIGLCARVIIIHIFVVNLIEPM